MAVRNSSSPLWWRPTAVVLSSTAAVALVTGVVFALRPVAPVLGLGVLYLFAVLFAAAVWGLAAATAVSIASMLAFNWFFLPPRHTLRLADSENWVALAVFLVTAVSVSGLAARTRRRTREAEQQRREASFAAEISALLLESPDVERGLPEIAARAADLLGVPHCWIELGSTRPPDADEEAHELRAGGRTLGLLFLDEGLADPATTARVSVVLAALLAAAIERDALARSDREKTALLRSVSHDLRSPLTAISAASEVLLGDVLAPDERDELLTSIRLQVQRLDRLVANLLDLSRLEAGAATPVAELWPVDTLVARALEALGRDGERIDVSVPDELPAVRVDAAQVEHALVNLLENALEHSSPAEAVELSAAAVEGEVVFRVVDRGPGIAAAEQESIFEPFRQGRSGAPHGSGLGLAIARGFVQVNGGRIWVESAPGRGATFAVGLPAVALPAAVEA